MRLRPSTRCLRGSCAELLFLLLISVLSPGQLQPSQDPDLQQLKDKLQRLELEMQELKGQISAVQQARISTPPAATVPSSASGTAQAAEKPPKPPRAEESKSSLDLYGFVMTDTGYDFGQTDPNWFDVMRPTKLPSYTTR